MLGGRQRITYYYEGRASMGQVSEKDEKINKLARDVLILSRNTLLVNLRFLDAALSQFEYVPITSHTLLTDGKHLFYNPRHILTEYKEDSGNVTRAYLHIVLHCIFQHMYGAPNLNRNIWDLACDIAVEATIDNLNLKATSVRRESEQQTVLQKLQKDVGKLTAEKIYRHFLDNKPSATELERLQALFRADNHEVWYWTIEQINLCFLHIGGEGASGQSDADGSGNDGDSDKDSGDGNSSGNGGNQSSTSEGSAQAQIWKKISERMQVDIETFQKSRGNVPGSMLQNLNEVNREKYDYTEFLRKFAVRGEVMKINDDEFDYIFYTYGLKLYEKMPLIEPLEYKEVKRIREFVIAIDTSGSVLGEEVQTFVQKTYNILKNTESFFSRINLHIIQCDAEIQEHVKITSQDEFDGWLKTMQIKGLGGTDFRPVFDKVNELIDQHEFTNLRGLIYFTDGYGIFPAKKPDYETAFVFVNDDYINPYVPPWAIKLVLQKSEL